MLALVAAAQAWLLTHRRPRSPSLQERLDAARPRAVPTYDAYPDRASPAPRPPRKTWIERLEEKLAEYARRRAAPPYDPHDGPPGL